jgi:hypothetical protein
MTEAEWLACEEPFRLLGHLSRQDETSPRKARLFACSCYRSVWERLAEPEREGEMVRRAVDLAEELAEGRIHASATTEFIREAVKGRVYNFGNGHDHYAVMNGLLADDLRRVTESASSYSSLIGLIPGRPWSRASQCALIRDLFARPGSCDGVVACPALTPLSASVALAAYEKRHLPTGQLDNARLAVLSDALEEAGCTDADILSHLRSPGPHVRGCWALDLVLGKG